MKTNLCFLPVFFIMLVSCDSQTITLPPRDNGIAFESITASAPADDASVLLTYLFKEDTPGLKEENIYLQANFSFIIVKDSFTQPDKSNNKKYEMKIIPGESGVIRAAIAPYSYSGWSVGSVQVTAVYNLILNFAYTGYNNALIRKYNKTKGGNVVIPDNFGDYAVLGIGQNSFRECELTDVYIPDSVIYIESYAFADNQLTSVTIPDGITTIYPYTFYGNQLTSVTIPQNVTAIGRSAFSGNQLTDVIIPEGVTSLSGFDNNKLTSVDIPYTVLNIEDYAFENNYLSVIDLSGRSVTGIGNNAFSNNQITDIKLPAFLTSIGVNAFAYNLLEEIEIPDGVSWLGGFNNNQLEEVSIPESVVIIGSYAFAGNKLIEIEIPESIRSIGSYAFANNQLDEIKIPKSVTIIDEGAFQNNLLTIADIPDNITISRYAFTGNRLTTIKIGENVILNGTVFGNGFEMAYNEQREAGVYTRTADTNKWNKDP